MHNASVWSKERDPKVCISYRISISVRVRLPLTKMECPVFTTDFVLRFNRVWLHDYHCNVMEIVVNEDCFV